MTHLLAAPVDLHQVAILLDVDGTIVDLAATPREVFVEKLVSQNRNTITSVTGPTTVTVVQASPLFLSSLAIIL